MLNVEARGPLERGALRCMQLFQIVRMHEREEAAERTGLVGFAQAVDLRRLPRPFDAVRAQVQLPATDLRDALRLDEMSLALAHALLRFAARRDVATDAQDADRLAARVALDAIRPGDPYALAVAAHVLVDVLLERLRRGADLIHQRFEIAAAAFGFGHERADDVPTDDFFFRVAEETQAELVEERDATFAVPS